MLDRTPAQRELFEAQAAACLLAAATHRAQLLAVAIKVAGSDEAGKDLFGDVCLNAHDAIQRGGFEGERYEWYLFAAIRNHYKRQQRRHHPTQPISESLADALSEEAGLCPDDRAHCVAQLAAEVRQTLPPADRVLLRLHADGYSYREISALTGAGEHSWLRRRIQKMITNLREALAPAWANLSDQ